MLTLTDETTYVNVPTPVVDRITERLDEMDIRYTLLNGPDIPTSVWEPVITFGGNRKFNMITCIQSNVDADELREFAEKVAFPHN